MIGNLGGKYGHKGYIFRFPRMSAVLFSTRDFVYIEKRDNHGGYVWKEIEDWYGLVDTAPAALEIARAELDTLVDDPESWHSSDDSELCYKYL